MTCARAEELLSDAREGVLHPVLRGELDAHLAGCARCRALAAALDQVMALLQSAREALAPDELEPAADLASRAATAALRAGRAASAAATWTRSLPRSAQGLAAGIALLATGAAVLGRAALAHDWPQRALGRAATAGVHLIERKDQAVEDLRLLRVMVGATFAGRVDSVSERVDDYKRLLERRRTDAARPAVAPAGPQGPTPPPGTGAAAPRPVSSAAPEHWAAGSDSANRGRTRLVREG